MRSLIFASRNAKELLRDPLTLIFGVGFPIVLLTLMHILSNSIPQMPENFSVGQLAPAMAVFGLSFISLFAGMLISGDRESSFLLRIFASPMTAADYILGYTLPLLGVAVLQCVLCFAFALLLGLPLSGWLAAAILALIPVALLFVGLGILLGTVLAYKQVGGISSVLVNVAAWLSNTWFDLNLIGGAFRDIGYALPFAHAVDLAKAASAGDLNAVFPHLWWVLAYAAALYALAVWLFRRKMKQ